MSERPAAVERVPLELPEPRAEREVADRELVERALADLELPEREPAEREEPVREPVEREELVDRLLELPDRLVELLDRLPELLERPLALRDDLELPELLAMSLLLA